MRNIILHIQKFLQVPHLSVLPPSLSLTVPKNGDLCEHYSHKRFTISVLAIVRPLLLPLVKAAKCYLSPWLFSIRGIPPSIYFYFYERLFYVCFKWGLHSLN